MEDYKRASDFYTQFKRHRYFNNNSDSYVYLNELTGLFQCDVDATGSIQEHFFTKASYREQDLSKLQESVKYYKTKG